MIAASSISRLIVAVSPSTVFFAVTITVSSASFFAFFASFLVSSPSAFSAFLPIFVRRLRRAKSGHERGAV